MTLEMRISEFDNQLSDEEKAAIDSAADKINSGMSPGLAIWEESEESGVDMSLIARELGRRGGSKKSSKKRR